MPILNSNFHITMSKVRGVLVQPSGGVEVVECIPLDVFGTLGSKLGRGSLGMTPISKNKRHFEFWYDDSGDHFAAGTRNSAMETLLGGGFYGPGVILERKLDNDDDTMLDEDYYDILKDWDGKSDLLEYLLHIFQRTLKDMEEAKMLEPAIYVERL